jgi:hypothetical protein
LGSLRGGVDDIKNHCWFQGIDFKEYEALRIPAPQRSPPPKSKSRQAMPTTTEVKLGSKVPTLEVKLGSKVSTGIPVESSTAATSGGKEVSNGSVGKGPYESIMSVGSGEERGY